MSENVHCFERTTSADAAFRALEHGAGVLRLAPAWVPRSFCVPGRRIRLHPSDYFALGGQRGGIDERWLASAVRADNGPLTAPDEGLSLVVAPDNQLVGLDEAVSHLGADLIGERLWDKFGAWPAYSKFFDNQGPLPFHVHHDDEHASLVGRRGKPEAYYYPPQMNNHLGDQPLSFFGLAPETTKDEFARRLAGFPGSGDNRITDLSVAYRLRLGTGWDIPPGVLHAPASLCTYEPQAASDVFAMCECWTSSRTLPEELLWKDVPAEHHGDYEYIVSLLDWETNIDPFFASHRFMEPIQVESEELGVSERWVVYRSAAFSAKELTLDPGTSAVINDAAAYGCIVVQGHGQLEQWPLESPTLIRFGTLTHDEYFVSESKAREGVRIWNNSPTQPLVLLKHFGPNNPDNVHADQSTDTP